MRARDPRPAVLGFVPHPHVKRVLEASKRLPVRRSVGTAARSPHRATAQTPLVTLVVIRSKILLRLLSPLKEKVYLVNELFCSLATR